MTVSYRWNRIAAGAALSAAIVVPALALTPVAAAVPCPPDVQNCVLDPVEEQGQPLPDQPTSEDASSIDIMPEHPEAPASTDEAGSAPGSFNDTAQGAPGQGRPAAPSWAPDADVVWNPDMSQWGVWMGTIFIPVF